MHASVATFSSFPACATHEWRFYVQHPSVRSRLCDPLDPENGDDNDTL